MIHYLTYLKDVIGNNYLGIKIDKGNLNSFLKELKSYLGDEFDEYIGNQQKRDGDSNHITVINVRDYNKLSKEMGMSKFVSSLEVVFKFPIDDLKMMGIGTAKKGENQTYFVVCKSEKLDSIRKRYNLPPHDFHITLGFKWKDVFGIRKNQVMDKKSDLIDFLKKEFIKKENFEFLKQIENWDENPDYEAIPIDIGDSVFKVRVKDKILGIALIDDELRVVYRFHQEKEQPRIPTTELIKIFQSKSWN